MANFDTVLPAIKQHKIVTRPAIDGKVQLIKCKDEKPRLRIWRGWGANYPYKIGADDLLAEDWEIL